MLSPCFDIMEALFAQRHSWSHCTSACTLQAEAERFVTRPFLMGTHDASQANPSPMQQGAAERTQRPPLQTRKTTSVFSPAQ